MLGPNGCFYELGVPFGAMIKNSCQACQGEHSGILSERATRLDTRSSAQDMWAGGFVGLGECHYVFLEKGYECKWQLPTICTMAHMSNVLELLQIGVWWDFLGSLLKNY